jgi:flagellar hook protein FlgE
MAFRIAVSGLRAATADLDVTGNNIANASTTGFKGSRVQFADVYAASNLGTSRDAIGQGVKVSDVAQLFTQGNVSFTDNSLDLAINGEGFFVVEDSEGRFYTRAGAFGLDKDGFVVNATGQRLLGYQAADAQLTGATGPLQISTTNLAPSATTEIAVQVNLDASSALRTTAFDPARPETYNTSVPLTVFDSLGEEHLATIYFQKSAANTWNTHLMIDGVYVNQDADGDGTRDAVPLLFNESGVLTSSTPTVFGDFDPAASTRPTGAAVIQDLAIDFTDTTQFGADFGVNALSQDGFTTGRLSGIDINSQGVVLARFSNGQTASQGQVMLANFGNPQGLQPMGNTLWVETTDSGPPLVGAPGTAALGLVQSGALEESNVDLAQELVDMIVAQRNFQANAQVIRTEDEVTQTIINIR